jgi:crotonobetainyl-CoA:carnitine CoA-transferase CaiB-like acyl-CoA transferase
VVESVVPTRSAARLIERAELLGLPCARVGEMQPPTIDSMVRGPVAATKVADSDPTPLRKVVDLSSLWAGPLCSRLLLDRGATVTKVEATTRSDAARRGSPAFFEQVNAGKHVVELDLTSGSGVDQLVWQMRAADVVIEASRPRALRQLGIVAEDLLASDRGPSIWISITGYGRGSNRVAFGDDAAAAGGLVAWDEDGPCFVADAVADPLTGIAAASAAVESANVGGRWLIDVSMSAVAAHVAGPDRGVIWQPEPRTASV